MAKQPDFSDREHMVLRALRSLVTSRESKWGTTDIYGAMDKSGMSEHVFSGYLASLWHKGYYRIMDGENQVRLR